MTGLGILDGPVEPDLSFLCWLGFVAQVLEVYRAQYSLLQEAGEWTWRSKYDLEPSSGCLLGSSPKSTFLLSTSPEKQRKQLECGWGCCQPWYPEHFCWGQGGMGMAGMALEDQDLCPWSLTASAAILLPQPHS